MKKIAFALVAIVAMAFASGAALAQGQAAHVGNWHGGGGNGGGWHGGGWHGGGWHGGGWHGPRVGVFVGYPGYWGAWGYPYYYPYSTYYPYSVYAPAEPAVYVPSAVDAAPAATSYWYYCTEPAGYYPYVQNCSKAWMQVVPQRGPNAPNVMPAQ